MRSAAPRDDNFVEMISASPHFKKQSRNYFLIVYLSAFPQEERWFPQCDLVVGEGSGLNKQPDFGALWSQVHTPRSYYHNGYKGAQSAPWLIG